VASLGLITRILRDFNVPRTSWRPDNVDPRSEILHLPGAPFHPAPPNRTEPAAATVLATKGAAREGNRMFRKETFRHQGLADREEFLPCGRSLCRFSCEFRKENASVLHARKGNSSAQPRRVSPCGAGIAVRISRPQDQSDPTPAARAEMTWTLGGRAIGLPCGDILHDLAGSPRCPDNLCRCLDKSAV
jgi:hypothetical protein